MYLKNIIKTIASKSGVLLINFFIIIITTRLWGAEGRGIISIVMADLTILLILNNTFSNSSVAFHINKLKINQLFIPAVIWITTISTIGSLFFYFILKHEGTQILFPLVFISSLTTFNLAVFLGKEKLSQYNIYNFLIPSIILISLLLINYCYEDNSSPEFYFWSYGFAQLVIWVMSFIEVKPLSSLVLSGSLKHIKKIFHYGWKNELSSFFQFLNYRLSYFIILYFIGLREVGIFSVGIALAESIWVISKSVSLVHFARVLNTDVSDNTIKTTNLIASISLGATAMIGIIIIFIPDYWFSLVFGNEFSEVKSILLMLFPGILSLSFSNVHGHFLAATGEMKPLVIKSALGLIVMTILSLILIPIYKLEGACIATASSHVVSSSYTYWAFIKTKSYVKMKESN